MANDFHFSEGCQVTEYGSEDTAYCSDNEQAAVACYDHWFDFNIRMNMKAKKKKTALKCSVNMIKEGERMKTKHMQNDIRGEWGGITVRPNQEDRVSVFEDGEDFSVRKFKKNAFKAVYRGPSTDYSCFYCKIYMGDMEMGMEKSCNPSD